jgi:tetratricopeptide (TPR) repeat protein
VELRPNEALSWGNLADSHRQLGQIDEAERAYRRAIELTENRLELDPENRDSRLGYAMYLAGLGQCADAEDQITQSLDPYANVPEQHYYAALAYAVCGERERVVEHVRHALNGGIVVDVRTNPDLRPYLDEPSLRGLLQ